MDWMQLLVRIIVGISYPFDRFQPANNEIVVQEKRIVKTNLDLLKSYNSLVLMAI